MTEEEKHRNALHYLTITVLQINRFVKKNIDAFDVEIFPRIHRHIFVKPYICRYKIFSRFARIFMQSLLDSCHEVRENDRKMSGKVSQIELTDGNPVYNDSMQYIFRPYLVISSRPLRIMNGKFSEKKRLTRAISV